MVKFSTTPRHSSIRSSTRLPVASKKVFLSLLSSHRLGYLNSLIFKLLQMLLLSESPEEEGEAEDEEFELEDEEEDDEKEYGIEYVEGR